MQSKTRCVMQKEDNSLVIHDFMRKGHTDGWMIMTQEIACIVVRGVCGYDSPTNSNWLKLTQEFW